MEGFEKSKIYNLKESIVYDIGGIVSKQIVKHKNGNVTLFSFDKGQGLSEHSAPFDALVQIIEGNIEIRIDKQPFALQAGNIIIMPSNIPHALIATEKSKMVLTMIKE